MKRIIITVIAVYMFLNFLNNPVFGNCGSVNFIDKFNNQFFTSTVDVAGDRALRCFAQSYQVCQEANLKLISNGQSTNNDDYYDFNIKKTENGRCVSTYKHIKQSGDRIDDITIPNTFSNVIAKNIGLVITNCNDGSSIMFTHQGTPIIDSNNF